MRLCILCEDANITDARKRSADVLPKYELAERLLELKKKKDPEVVLDHLKIPLSSTGELPATHWFCFINVNEAMYQKMLESQKYTIIEEAVPSEFLAKHNLKKIKSFGPGL
jgi:hypothetical protein